MIFNDPTNKLGLIQDITFNLGGVDTNQYSLADRTRNINEREKMVWHTIFESYGGWQFMDDNTSDTSTGVPYADQSISSGVGLYGIPSGALTISSIWIKLTSGGNWIKLTPLTHEEFIEMGGDGYFANAAVPEYYLPQGDIIRLLNVPNFSLASALRVYFDQGISEFAASDTTKVPGFVSIFHRALSVGASIDFAVSRISSKDMQARAAYLTALWNDYLKRIGSFYAKRYKEKFPKQIRAGTDLVQEYS